MLDDRHQPAARIVGLGERQGLDGAAQGGQRVLQLVADIGREALDRVDAPVERLRHVAQGARQVADLVGALGEIGDFLAGLDAHADLLGRLRQAPHRPRDGARQQERQHHHHRRGDEEHLQQAESLRGDDPVDGVALGRDQQGAADGAGAVDRHGHRDRGLAELVAPDEAAAVAAEGRLDLAEGVAVHRPGLLRLLGPAAEQAAELRLDRLEGGFEHPGLVRPGLERVGPARVAALEQGARVEQEAAFLIVDPGAVAGGRDEAREERRHLLGVEREGERLRFLLGGLAGLLLEQLVGVDPDRVGVHRRRGRDGARDDLALDREALDPGLDQALPELVEVQEPDEERDQPDEVEDDDAARQARRRALADRVPEGAGPGERPGEGLGQGGAGRRIVGLGGCSDGHAARTGITPP